MYVAHTGSVEIGVTFLSSSRMISYEEVVLPPPEVRRFSLKGVGGCSKITDASLARPREMVEKTKEAGSRTKNGK